MIRYDPHLRRLWLCGARIHHGLLGAVLCAVGAVLMAHDWKDAPWLRD